jgi:hypothetical protein
VLCGSSIEMEYIKLFWEGAPEGEPPVILYEVDTENERLALRSIDVFTDGHTRNIPDPYDGAIEITPIPTVEELEAHVWGREFHACLAEKTEFEAIWENGTGFCPSCGQLAVQMKEASGGSYRQYDQILRKLTELERQGEMELLAGDCPLEDTDAVLEAEQHYTVCHYMRCRSCGALYFVGACIRGAPVFRQVEDMGKENLDTRLWGRCGTYYLQKKD